MNCKEIIIDSLRLSNNNGGLNIEQIDSSGNVDGEMLVNEIYIDGLKLELNDTYDGLQLTGINENVEISEGIINVNSLITNDFIIQNNELTSLIHTSDVTVNVDSSGVTLTNSSGIIITTHNKLNLLNDNEYRVTYRLNYENDDITLLKSSQIIEIYVTIQYYDLEGGFHGMTDVSGNNYLDLTTNEGDYDVSSLYKVRIVILNDVPNIYMWGIMCEILEKSTVTYILHIYSDVYGIPNSTYTPMYENRLSYTPAFDTQSSEYIMDLYSWLFANTPYSSPALMRISVWVKTIENVFEYKTLVVPTTGYIYDMSYMTLISQYEPLPSLDYTIGSGRLDIPVSMQGTYTAYDQFLAKQAARRWSSLVKSPINSSHQIDMTVKFSQLGTNILGSAGPTNFTYQNRWYTTAGRVELNTLYWDDEKTVFKHNHLPLAYFTLLHEMGHVLGIGTLWLDHGLISSGSWYRDTQWWNSDYTSALYIGSNAVREYKAYISLSDLSLDLNNIQGIPIEDDGGAGTKGGHLEEGDSTSITGGHFPRTFGDGIAHPGLDHELMTGWAESGLVPEPLSKITIGMLNDLGYDTDYAKADDYIL